METEKQDTLKIEKLIYRGNGLGHHEGKAVFVPRTVPGDLVRWTAKREKKRHIQARLLKVLQPSPDRIAPPCIYFPRCGGCHWQHMPYPVQLHWKREIVREILGKEVSLSPGLVAPVRPSPSPWHYRARVRLQWGKRGVGFYQGESHRLIRVASCMTLEQRLDGILGGIQRMLGSSPIRKGREVLLEVGDTGNPRVVLRLDGPVDAIPEILRGMQSLAIEEEFSLWVEEPGKDPFLDTGTDTLTVHPAEGIRLAVPPYGFFQANLAQNRRLTALVVEAVAGAAPPSRPPKILDLYCGMGNFSIPMARYGWQVTGADASPVAIETARQNARENRAGEVAFLCADAGDVLSRRKEVGNPPLDILVLDPPRTGARKVAESLVSMEQGPGTLVYVACDPMTCARDLKILCVSAYRIDSVIPVDLFPQTFHIETVTVLRRQ